MSPGRAALISLYRSALRRVDPRAMVTERVAVRGSSLIAAGDGEPVRIDLDRYGEVRLIGVGKAAAAMGRGVEELLGERLTGGVAVTKLGHAGAGLRRARLLEAEHPVPGELSAAAGRAIADECRRAGADTLMIGVISGGGSALLTAPAEGLTLSDKQHTTRLLLAAGATIGEVTACASTCRRSRGAAWRN